VQEQIHAHPFPSYSDPNVADYNKMDFRETDVRFGKGAGEGCCERGCHRRSFFSRCKIIGYVKNALLHDQFTVLSHSDEN